MDAPVGSPNLKVGGGPEGSPFRIDAPEASFVLRLGGGPEGSFLCMKDILLPGRGDSQYKVDFCGLCFSLH